ncbi:amino acid ABC transporter permease [Pectobacterium carotovorum]|uniref:amino acid ABC transporter permease n=1 Tax=Pectobacterium carotovorum TaxID=554 RepID=UPI000580A908|nr:ABC transporter permease subunit [Pectobacterium carotovorum]KHT24492.1 amino acid ABC transporter permease [Pectobacterium carotovorum subsp. carotovorum]GKV91986.1 ABC transporter permease [Pectobacterium carotovorum subsp. carotovorum]GKW09234.1 ABC transporter permease [Pectobacterium carotovorum subsp. carotovorum]
MKSSQKTLSSASAPPWLGTLPYSRRLLNAFDSKSLRAWIYQCLLGLLIVAFSYWLYANVVENLRSQNIATGFGFLDHTAQFEIGEKLIAFTPRDSYLRALGVGLLNTLYVTLCGIVLATLLGFSVGIARVSRNWLLARLAGGYIELMRNIPVILQVIFWSVVIRNLPSPRDAIELGSLGFLTNRGLSFSVPAAHHGWLWTGIALLAAVLISLILKRVARYMRENAGRSLPTGRLTLAAIIGLPLLVWWLSGAPAELDRPILRGFNFRGGFTVSPEFTALLLGIALYSSAFIAEIVRAGIQSIPKGQLEAARALSFSPWHMMRHIIIPQAMRVIVPPLTSQYVSLSKNSSIAVVVGYPELANISNTLMNQTGQALEVIAIMMVVYLTVSIVTSLLMNLFNRVVAIKER